MTDGKYGGIFQKLNSRSLQCNWQQPERRPQFLTPICRRSDKLAFGNFLENGGLGPKSGLVAITGIPGFWRNHNDLVCTAIKNNAVTRNKKPHTGSAILIISHSLLFYICGLQLLCLELRWITNFQLHWRTFIRGKEHYFDRHVRNFISLVPHIFVRDLRETKRSTTGCKWFFCGGI